MPRNSQQGLRKNNMRSKMKNIAYVTGTRADFGLMTPVLRAINRSKKLKLQVYATGIGSGSGWLMLFVFAASFYFYMRFKKARREMMQQGKR